jgi:competence protein ComEC
LARRCLLRSPLRWSGVVLAVVATVWAATAPLPDVIVAGDGRAAAIRGLDGRLAVLASGRDSFAIKEWLMADGDNRLPTDKSLRDGVRCDAIGCIGRLTDGRLASMALKIDAFAEDCARAAVVVSAREAQGACAATLIDRRIWRAHGAVALRWTGKRFAETYAIPPGTDRPWARAPVTAAETAQPASPARDATPRQQDLEAED